MDAIGVDAILQLRRLPSLSIQPSQRTRSKKATPVDNTQTHISRAKDWRRDAEASGPCSLDVLILRLEEGNNFKVFQHGGKGKKKSFKSLVDWAQLWRIGTSCSLLRALLAKRSWSSFSPSSLNPFEPNEKYVLSLVSHNFAWVRSRGLHAGGPGLYDYVHQY